MCLGVRSHFAKNPSHIFSAQFLVRVLEKGGNFSLFGLFEIRSFLVQELSEVLVKMAKNGGFWNFSQDLFIRIG